MKNEMPDEIWAFRKMELKKLTPEQEAQLPKIRDEWLRIGLSTEPLNFEKAKAAAIDAYKVSGLKEPKLFLTARSPIEAALTATILKNKGSKVWEQVWDQVRNQIWDQVRDQVWDQVWDQVRNQIWDQVWDQVGDQVSAQVRDQIWDQVRDQVWDQVGDQVRNQIWDQVWDQVGDQVSAQVSAQVYGNHDSVWLSFYDTFGRFGIDATKLKPLIELAKHCGWWAPYKGLVILQDRPSLIKFDDQKRLHCENGPAISYRDGFSVFSWHGTRIPGEWIKQAPTAQEALTWDNLEQRRAACEIVGWVNVLNQLNARVIDADQNPEIGELLEVDIPDIGREQFLKVRCGTGRDFALPVPPEVKTARQANAWTYGLDINEYQPEVRT